MNLYQQYLADCKDVGYAAYLVWLPKRTKDNLSYLCGTWKSIKTIHPDCVIVSYNK